ncbi:hypothetical protein BC835DRAFT_594802 [Cytidiella melzeri]|nr:hypothetical protein BC835DRAFT_594802 [Cytidiella melzeri]
MAVCLGVTRANYAVHFTYTRVLRTSFLQGTMQVPIEQHTYIRLALHSSGWLSPRSFQTQDPICIPLYCIPLLALRPCDVCLSVREREEWSSFRQINFPKNALTTQLAPLDVKHSQKKVLHTHRLELCKPRNRNTWERGHAALSIVRRGGTDYKVRTNSKYKLNRKQTTIHWEHIYLR